MAVLITMATAAACTGGTASHTQPSQPVGIISTAAATSHQLLASLRTVSQRPTVPGYDRSCAAGHGCVFGPAWSDDVDVAFGHDGCTTRDNILATQLTQVVSKPGNRCVVIAGDLLDPYTGKQIHFTKDRAATVAVDHVIPLAVAWDCAAAAWTPRQRRNFANEPGNLLATSAAVNTAKGDQSPAQWRPESPSGRCLYAQRYITTAATYALPVTPADRQALLEDLTECR